MPKQKVNTTSSIASSKKLTEAEYRRDLERVKRKLQEEKLVKISIPKQLRSVLGATLPVGINGVVMNIPVDGSEYEVPEPMAKIIKDSLKVIQVTDVDASVAGLEHDGQVDWSG